MARLGFCIPCGENHRDVDATLVIDGDPMCNAHAAAATKGPADLCSRGCGKPPHRGLCVGQRVIPHPKPIATSSILLVQKFFSEIEEIDITAIPAEPKSQRKPLGRIGLIWTSFLKLEKGKALKVACKDRKSVGATARSIKEKGKEHGILVGERRVGCEGFFWKENQQ